MKGDGKRAVIWGLVALSAAIICVASVAGTFLLFGFGVERRSTEARTVPPMEDVALVRTEFGVPPNARLVSLDADPTVSGTFGREGLRIVAVFSLPEADYSRYERDVTGRPGWQPLPLPESISAFAGPPVELPSGVTGLGFCQTGVWATGTTYTPHPCDPPPARFDQYRAAVLDAGGMRLTVVLKNYY